MSYRYTDENRNFLDIATARHTPNGPRIAVNFEHYDEDSEQWAHLVKFEDAPAVALAILEAAGVYENQISDPDVMSAWHALNAYQIRREEDAEQEAEDAKVRGWHHAMWPHAYGATGKVNDRMRAEYATARKFFEESK